MLPRPKATHTFKGPFVHRPCEALVEACWESVSLGFREVWAQFHSRHPAAPFLSQPKALVVKEEVPHTDEQEIPEPDGATLKGTQDLPLHKFNQEIVCQVLNFLPLNAQRQQAFHNHLAILVRQLRKSLTGLVLILTLRCHPDHSPQRFRKRGSIRLAGRALIREAAH
jgi:hypothetical protein